MGDGCDAYSVWARWLVHLAAGSDCHDLERIGYEFALRSRAKEADRSRLFQRWNAPSDRGTRSSKRQRLIFQSRRFQQLRQADEEDSL